MTLTLDCHLMYIAFYSAHCAIALAAGTVKQAPAR